MRIFSKLLLGVIVFIFTAISVFTTKVGFAQMWSVGDPLVREVMAWGIALGIGLTLVYISVRIVLGKGKKYWLILMTYLLLMSLSVFFNFNAIFGYMAKRDYLENDLQNIRTELLELRVEGDRSANESLDFTKLKDTVVRLENEKDIEKNYYGRKGEGQKFHALDRELQRTSGAKLKIASQKWGDLQRKVDSILDPVLASLDSPDSLADVSKGLLVIKRANKAFAELVVIYQGVNPEFKFSREYSTLADRIDRPEATLQVVVKFLLGELGSGTASSADFFRAILALILSAVIDLPLFVSSVVMHAPEGRFLSRLQWLVNGFFRKRSKRKGLFSNESLSQKRTEGGRPNGNLWG